MAPDEPSDFDLLVKFMTAPVHQFGLAIATADHRRVLDDTRARAEAAAAAAGRRVATLAVTGDRPIIDQLGAAADAADVIFVIGLETFLLGPLDQRVFSPLIEQFNWNRDRLSTTLRVRVVLWLPRPAALALADAARDLNDVVLTRLHFDDTRVRAALAPDVPALTVDRLSEDVPFTGGGDRVASLLDTFLATQPVDSIGWADAAMLRASRWVEQGDDADAQALVERAFQIYDREGATARSVEAYLQLAAIMAKRGEFDEALRILRDRAVPLAETNADARLRAVAMGRIADLLEIRGDLEAALRIRREDELPTFERLGDLRSKAITMSKIADILQVRGDLDEAGTILRDDALPLFERLGDVRSKAIAMGKIADILQTRGNLDEALRIRREEELPVYERIGDAREKAVTMGKIADILEARGDLDEALRIRRDEELPVYERQGAVRHKALTMGKIADILQARGDLDEALRVRRDIVLPVIERLGDVRSKAVTMGKIADILSARGDFEEALRIRREEELPVYERIGDMRHLCSGLASYAMALLAARPTRERISEVRDHLRRAVVIADRIQIPVSEHVRGLLAALEQVPG